jgi:cell shape-determining protein MreC
MAKLDSSICRYYFITSLVFLIMAIYCSIYVGNHSSGVCVSSTETTPSSVNNATSSVKVTPTAIMNSTTNSTNSTASLQ